MNIIKRKIIVRAITVCFQRDSVNLNFFECRYSNEVKRRYAASALVLQKMSKICIQRAGNVRIKRISNTNYGVPSPT